LASIGAALAANSGVTVTVFALLLTILLAAKLKSIASCDAPFEETLKASLGSSLTVSCTWPTACPFAPIGVNAMPLTLPSSYTICAEL